MAAAAFDPRRAAAAILSAELDGLTLDDAERARRRCLLSTMDGGAAAAKPAPSPSSPSAILPGLRPIVTSTSTSTSNLTSNSTIAYAPPVPTTAGSDLHDDESELDLQLDPSQLDDAVGHELRSFLTSIYLPAYNMQAKLYASRKNAADLQRRYHDHVEELESKLRRSESYAELLQSRIRELELELLLQSQASPITSAPATREDAAEAPAVSTSTATAAPESTGQRSPA